MSNNKSFKAKINANGKEISILSTGNENDYISLTDIAKYKNPDSTSLKIKQIQMRLYYYLFASWVSPEFKLYIIKDYQRLKDDENSKLSLEWNVSRVLTKLNYKIHMDAIKENLISNALTASLI